MMTKKKLLCFLMMLCMVFTLIPVSAFAESDTVKFSALDGTGTGGEGYDKLLDGEKTADNGSKNCTRYGKESIQQLGAFTVSNAIKDEDYTYENNELKILTASPITIRNTDPNTATTLDRIVVAKDVSANVTLAGVNIDVSETNGACAFKIEDDSRQDVTVTLLEGTKNILKSGSRCAGIQKNGKGDSIGTLYIKGSGMLEVTGGYGSAGIGAGQFRSVRCIEICSGNIIAQGGENAPGIGGANVGVAKDIMITGGVIRATGGTGGPGIGGGASGNI